MERPPLLLPPKGTRPLRGSIDGALVEPSLRSPFRQRPRRLDARKRSWKVGQPFEGSPDRWVSMTTMEGDSSVWPIVLAWAVCRSGRGCGGYGSVSGRGNASYVYLLTVLSRSGPSH